MAAQPPETTPDLAALSAALADSTRSLICICLLDGRAWTVTELAAELRAAKSSVSEHVSTLVGAGLLIDRRQGRHRYLQLASPAVASWLEQAGSISDRRLTPVSTLRTRTRDRHLAEGRTCYRHLAGRLGVGLAAGLLDKGWLDQFGQLTAAGRDGLLTAWGVDVPEDPANGRPLATWCLDWTERRSHLGGRLGDELCATFLARSWVVRRPTGRAVMLTPAGTTELGWVLHTELHHL